MANAASAVSLLTVTALGMEVLRPTPSFGASSLPKAGYYSELYFVISASVSGGSGACMDPAGTYFTEEGYYPGPAKPGAREYRVFSSASGLANQINVFPETPAAGSTNWSGAYTTSFPPGGGKPIKATFNTNYVFTDAASSVSTTTVTYPAPGGGTCTTNLQTNSIYTGQ